MLDALVRGAVFAQADAVMGEHMDHPTLHQSRHADRVAAVVAEGQKGAAVGDVAAMQRNAVHDGRHAELAHTVVDVAADARRLIRRVRAGGAGHDVAGQIHPQRGRALGVGEVGAGQVGAAAQHLGQRSRQRFQCQLAGLARRHGLGLAVRSDHRVHHHLVELPRQLALHAADKLPGLRRERELVSSELGVPRGFCSLAIGLGVPVGIDRFGHRERRMWPAQGLARQPDFISPQWLAMGLGGVGAVRAAFADLRLAEHQRRLVCAVSRVGDGARHGGHVMAVDRANHIPTVGGKALRRVVDKPGRDLAVDGNAVVVVQRDQLVQLPGACQRAGLVADALHQAAVAHEDIGVVVHDVQVHVTAGASDHAVELLGEQLFGQRHAHRVGQTLPQRTGSGFNARRDVHFRMTGRLAVQLAKVLQLGHRQLVARQVQQRIQQHGAMAVGEHKAVAVSPLRVAG